MAKNVVWVAGTAFALCCIASGAWAEESQVDYDTQTGYIRAVRPVEQSSTASPSADAPGQSRRGSASPSPAIPGSQGQGGTRAQGGPQAQVTTASTSDGTLVVQHGQGAAPDPVRSKVDLRSLTVVANDQIHPEISSVVLRAGSTDTVAVPVMKCSSQGDCLTTDSSQIWVGLVPVVNGEIALPGTRLGGTRPNGRILRMPRGFQQGRATITLRAAPTAGEDVLVITQPGLEPRFVRVMYE